MKPKKQRIARPATAGAFRRGPDGVTHSLAAPAAEARPARRTAKKRDEAAAEHGAPDAPTTDQE